MATVAEALAVASRYREAGELQHAESVCRHILEADPENAGALHLLGLLAQAHMDAGTASFQQGQLDEAVSHFQASLRLQPDRPETYTALGAVVARLGRMDEALASYRQVVRLKPFEPWAHTDLGSALRDAGRTDEAVASFEEALRLRPSFPEAHNNLGIAFVLQGKKDRAEASFREAVRLRPDYAKAHANLGNVLREQRRPEEAAASYREALRLQPHYADAHVGLAGAYMDQRKLDLALATCRELLQVNPDSAEAYQAQGAVLAALGEKEQAVASYQEALRLRPSWAEAHSGLGLALAGLDRMEEAEASCRRATQLQPDSPGAYNDLGSVLFRRAKLEEAVTACRYALRLRPDFAAAHHTLAVIFTDQAKFEDAKASFRRAMQLLPNDPELYNNLGSAFFRQDKLEVAVAACRQALRLRPDYASACNNLAVALMALGKLDEAAETLRQALRLEPDYAAAHSGLLFCVVHDHRLDPAQVYAEHCRWGQLHAPPVAPVAYPNDRRPERRLRVGYVSPDFRHHALSFFFEPVLAHHDPERVEVFCYAEVRVPDAVTARLRALAPHWRWTCGLSDAEVAELVRADEIDILVDLAGHTGNNRLLAFAQKPAPVQATFLGHPHTTGMSAIDYRLTDAIMDPPEAPGLGTEEPFRLPLGFCSFQPPAAPEVGPLPARRRGHVTFGSLHKPTKINSGVLDLWCEVLRAVPSSRLRIFRNTLRGRMREDLLHEFVRRGIPGERLALRSEADKRGHLGVYSAIDISLDPFPYGGGATACESLWMGVPYPTLRGDRPAARQGAAILTRVGLSDWIADTPEQYVRRAVEASRDLRFLETLRARLRDRMHQTICDGTTYTRTLEDAYQEMWRRWCERQND